MNPNRFYNPLSEFKKKEKFSNDFFRYRYFVWEQLEDLPTLWTFYEDTNNLIVESKTGKKNLKWSILSHLKLLSIQAQNGIIDQNSNYEIWQTSDNVYYELRGVLDGKLVRLMREEAVEEVYRKDLIRLPLSEIVKTEHYQVETYLQQENKLKKQTQNAGCLFYLVSIFVVGFITLETEQLAVFMLYLISYFVAVPIYTTSKIDALRQKNTEITYHQKVLAQRNNFGAYFMPNLGAALGWGAVIVVILLFFMAFG